MAHYAFLDENNIVTEVITGRNENEIVDSISDWESHYSHVRGQVCLRTSYHGKIRKNFAGIGFTYDAKLDAFIPPKPFESWLLNQDSCQWQAPKAYPIDGLVYSWSEGSLNWEPTIFEPENQELES